MLFSFTDIVDLVMKVLIVIVLAALAFALFAYGIAALRRSRLEGSGVRFAQPACPRVPFAAPDGYESGPEEIGATETIYKKLGRKW